DIKESIYVHRIKDFNCDNFYTLYPTTASQLLEIVAKAKETISNRIYVLDSINLIKEDWDLKKNFFNISVSIRQIDPDATVICLAKHYSKIDGWTNVVSIEK